jgi:hypothetical protein
MRVLPDGRQLLKRSHVAATKVAVGTGNLHHKNRACLT